MKNKGLIARRKMMNRFFILLSVAAAGFGLVWLGLILYSLGYNGFSAINVKVFTEITPPPGEKGGLINAIVGSVIMSTNAVDTIIQALWPGPEAVRFVLNVGGVASEPRAPLFT